MPFADLARRYDVVVVGARCAGAATAMLLARSGLEVLCIERARYASDTLSTHALMRGGVLQLHRWGLLDAVRSSGAPRVAQTCFHYGDELVAIDIRPQAGVDGLYAPRRPVIDALLVDAARESGARVEFGVRLVELRRSPEGRVCALIAEGPEGEAVEIATRFVVGADGVRSTVARLVDAQAYAEARNTTAIIYNYWAGVGLEGYHWYYRPGVSAGAIATNGGMCIFAAMPPARFEAELRHDLPASYRQVLGECDPALGEAVADADALDRYRAFAGQLGYFRQSHGPGWALVGDAGYFKDPITAHGITDALVDAEGLAIALVAALKSGAGDQALADYQSRRDARGRGLFEVTDVVASLAWELPELQQLHRSLSANMKREIAEIESRDPS